MVLHAYTPTAYTILCVASVWLRVFDYESLGFLDLACGQFFFFGINDISYSKCRLYISSRRGEMSCTGGARHVRSVTYVYVIGDQGDMSTGFNNNSNYNNNRRRRIHPLYHGGPVEIRGNAMRANFINFIRRDGVNPQGAVDNTTW